MDGWMAWRVWVHHATDFTCLVWAAAVVVVVAVNLGNLVLRAPEYVQFFSVFHGYVNTSLPSVRITVVQSKAMAMSKSVTVLTFSQLRSPARTQTNSVSPRTLPSAANSVAHKQQLLCSVRPMSGKARARSSRRKACRLWPLGRAHATTVPRRAAIQFPPPSPKEPSARTAMRTTLVAVYRVGIGSTGSRCGDPPHSEGPRCTSHSPGIACMLTRTPPVSPPPPPPTPFLQSICSVWTTTNSTRAG
ncbi:hypothetical protein C8Q78DRAFT_653351 [Trametes maxima]|nr:hypothetical protein C8Q78DRAFT_653351 [Trametes maxima]